MPDRPPLSRRRFLKTAAGASALAAAPYFVPSTALGRGGAVPPSEKIIVGAIGIQHRGMHDLGWLIKHDDVQFVAICDLQKKQRLAIKDYVDKYYGTEDCAMYPEINEFLAARPDIDAVLIATGDHWHAMASILAMRAGKDVYTEKPSCMTIAEGRAVVETARRYARVYQTGTQRLSEPNHVFCIEMARTGRLGKIHTAYAHIAPWDAAEMRHDWLPAVEEPPKDVVDWNAWLGACAWRPYNPSYVAGGWRGFYDFHTSCIGEWGAHTFAQAQAGLGLRRVVANRIRIRAQRQRRRDGHPFRQRRADDPLAREQVLARLVRRAVRRHGRLGCGRRRLFQARRVVAGPARREFNRVDQPVRRPHRPVARPHAELPRLRSKPRTNCGQSRKSCITR